MQHYQAIETYVELNLDIEAEEARRGSYPQEIGIKLFKLLETMTSTQIKEGEALLERVRDAKRMGNL
jgi:hypothetical protein